MQKLDHREMDYAPLYISKKTRNYLRGLYQEMKAMRVDVYYVAWGSNVAREKLVDILQGRFHLTCKEFLSLATFMEWQVKDTPNYIWYHVIYPPEDLTRRLFRLNITSPCNVRCQYRPMLRHMFDCFFGQYPITPHELQKYLWYIQMEERKRGFEDCIKMEGRNV